MFPGKSGFRALNNHYCICVKSLAASDNSKIFGQDKWPSLCLCAGYFPQHAVDNNSKT